VNRRHKILLGCLALLALLTLACNDLDMDRSEWGWDGRYGDEPVPPTPHPRDVAAQIQRRGKP